MSSDDFIWMFIGAIVVVVLSVCFSFFGGERNIKQQAISHGYASYEIVDAKTGKTEFKWRNDK